MSKKANAREKLVNNIAQYPDNIQAAIRLTSRQTKLSVNQLNYMYYGTKKNPGIRNTEYVFMVVTDKGMTINRKRSDVVKETKRTLTLENSRPVDLTNFSDQEKIAFVDMLASL